MSDEYYSAVRVELWDIYNGLGAIYSTCNATEEERKAAYNKFELAINKFKARKTKYENCPDTTDCNLDPDNIDLSDIDWENIATLDSLPISDSSCPHHSYLGSSLQKTITDEYNVAKVAYDLAEKEYGIAADKLNAVRGKFNIVNADCKLAESECKPAKSNYASTVAKDERNSSENKEGEGNDCHSKLRNDLDSLYSPRGISQDLEKAKENLKFIEDALKSDFIKLYGFDEDYDFMDAQNELGEAFATLCYSQVDISYNLGMQFNKLKYVNTKLEAIITNHYSLQIMPENADKAQQALVQAFIHFYNSWPGLKQDLMLATQNLQRAENGLQYTRTKLGVARYRLTTAQVRLEQKFAKLEACYSEGLLGNLLCR